MFVRSRFPLAILAATLIAAPARTASVTFVHLLALKPNEGVFAYARISPSGRYLAYASEMPNPGGAGVIQTETVVDLKNGRSQFAEPGVDGYFSNDGQRLVFLSFAGPGGSHNVALFNLKTRKVTHDIAPADLGDYFSWAVRDGRNLIVTIASYFYYLDGDHAVLPFGRVPSCPGIGVGERPLVSKDGRRITTFINGHVVVRDLTDCENIFDTGLQGAKADFSWDGRYIAFHVAKADRQGSEIVIVDTTARTVRTLTGLPGSSVFPSWTRDGRLCFRYEGDDYRGFMMATNVLSLPARPLGVPSPELPKTLTWDDLFPDVRPAHRINVVMIWSDWSAHVPSALIDLQRLAADARERHLDVGVETVVPESARRQDIDRILRANAIDLPQLPLSPERLRLTGALNQIPTELLFRDGALVDQHLGPLAYADLVQWLASAINQGKPLGGPGQVPAPQSQVGHTAQ